MKPRLFSGCATALVTPMNQQGEIDYAAAENLIEYQIEQGAEALVVEGTTGEASTLTEKEREELAAFAVKTVNGRVPLIVGTGCNDTARTVCWSLNAQELGADGLLVVTPYYNKASQEGLVRHFFAVADQVKIPVIVYHVPSRTGVRMTPETVERLAAHPQITGMKEASGDLSLAAQIAARCGSNLDLYSGNDDQTLPFLSLGGQGVISVAGNLIPHVMSRICSLYREGKQRESLQLHLKYLEVMNAMFCQVNPIPVKAAMAMIGRCGETCRLPLTSLEEEKKTFLKGVLERAALL